MAEQHSASEPDGFENFGQYVERVTLDVVDWKAATKRWRRAITGARIHKYTSAGSFGKTPWKIAPSLYGAKPFVQHDYSR